MSPRTSLVPWDPSPCFRMELPRVPCRAWDVCLLKALLAEFMGTGIFLFTGLASPNPLHVSLAFGSSVALMSYYALPLSGGHLNPAVTVSMLVAVKVRPAWAMCYILAQLLGGITASALLYGLTPEHARGEMGVNKVSNESQGSGELVLLGEVIVSFQLVLCILATSGSKRDPAKGGHLVIGLSVMLGHLAAIGYTGCSMNPARSLGPALITFEFANHWVFWLGPLGGGLAAAILNELVLAPTGSGFRQWLAMLQEGPKAELNLQSKAESTTQEMGLSETP
uniref:Uncharacterized protein n=1 Tax=Chrysemys picta bellii TaxID=8478 RepID=A0A8C3ICY4_CHRPI